MKNIDIWNTQDIREIHLIKDNLLTILEASLGYDEYEGADLIACQTLVDDDSGTTETAKRAILNLELDKHFNFNTDLSETIDYFTEIDEELTEKIEDYFERAIHKYNDCSFRHIGDKYSLIEYWTEYLKEEENDFYLRIIKAIDKDELVKIILSEDPNIYEVDGLYYEYF